MSGAPDDDVVDGEEVKEGEEGKEGEKKDDDKKKKEIEDPVELERKIQELKAQIIVNEAKNITFLTRQLNQETDFDASQGKCCFTWGNRRGSKLVILVDLICFFYLPRFFVAVLAWKDEKRFGLYAKVIRPTFYLNLIACIGRVFAYIVIDVLKTGGKNYLYILTMLILSLTVLGLDFHFTNVVVFKMNHPPQKKDDINWLDSDSEPQFAFQKYPDCPEMADVEQP